MYNKNKDKRHLRKQSKTITETGNSLWVIKGRDKVVNSRYEESETEDNKEETGSDKTRVQNLRNGAS